MREKNKTKTLFPHPSLFPSLNFSPNSCTYFLFCSAGGWGMGLVVSSWTFVSAFPFSSHFYSDPAWGSPTGDSLSWHFPMWVLPIVCSSWTALVLVQTFKNGLLQQGFHVGPQMLSEDLLQHELFSKGHSSCKGPAPVCHSPQSALWVSAPEWSSTGCVGTTCITMVFSMGYRVIFPAAQEDLLPLLLQWPWCLQNVSLIFSYSSLTVPVVLQWFYHLFWNVITEAPV